MIRVSSALVAFGLAASVRLRAQNVPPQYAEFRADVITGNGTTTQAGAGLVVPLDIYVRLGLDAAVGSTWRDGVARGSGRVDGIARFLLDPFRQVPLGLSLGGGLSVPYVVGEERLRPYLTAVIDVEGRMRGPITPAIEVGLGGGTRVGVVLRASPSRWR